MFNRFRPDQQLTQSNKHKTFIESQPCPQCKETKLKVAILEEGRKGWEARITCTGCGARTVLNNSGFHVEFTEEAKQNDNRLQN